MLKKLKNGLYVFKLKVKGVTTSRRPRKSRYIQRTILNIKILNIEKYIKRKY